MRIAVISTPSVASWGGSEELWASAVREALARGHSVVVSPRLDIFSGGRQLAELSQLGASIVPKFPERPSVADDVSFAAPNYADFLRNEFDVVLINNGGRYAGLFDDSLVGLVEALKRPYVVNCRLVDDGDCIPLQKQAAAAKLLTGAAAVVVPSKHNLVAMERHIAHKLPQGIVLHSPAGMSTVDSVPWPMSDATPSFACVARLDPAQKGQDMLLQVLADEVWRARSWRLNLYGNGLARDYLERLAHFCGISERVAFHGHAEDIRLAWAENQMLVLPSRCEGMPIAVIEAMLCGRPVTATDVGGVREWVEDGRSGFIAAGTTANAIAEALERVWADRSRWPEMGAFARSAALDRYDVNVGRSLFGLLRDITE